MTKIVLNSQESDYMFIKINELLKKWMPIEGETTQVIEGTELMRLTALKYFVDLRIDKLKGGGG